MNCLTLNSETGKYNCVCGSSIGRTSRGRHLQTKKHITFMTEKVVMATVLDEAESVVDVAESVVEVAESVVEVAESVTCECGSRIRPKSLNRHVLTKKHISYILTTLPNEERYNCACGTTILTTSVRNHLKSKQHAFLIREQLRKPPDGFLHEQHECAICMEMKPSFFKCTRCRNIHCTSCHRRMQRCPFCRTDFHSRR